MSFDFNEYAELIDNGNGTFTFVSPDTAVANVTFESSQVIGGGVIDQSFETQIYTNNIEPLIVPNITAYQVINVRISKKNNLRGIDSTGVPNGMVLWIFNDSDDELTIEAEKGQVVEPYRFSGEDVKIKPQMMWVVKYNKKVAPNEFDSRWNPLSKV